MKWLLWWSDGSPWCQLMVVPLMSKTFRFRPSRDLIYPPQNQDIPPREEEHYLQKCLGKRIWYVSSQKCNLRCEVKIESSWYFTHMNWGYTDHNPSPLDTIGVVPKWRKDRQGFEDEITGYLNMVNKLGSHLRHQDMVGKKCHGHCCCACGEAWCFE